MYTRIGQEGNSLKYIFRNKHIKQQDKSSGHYKDIFLKVQKFILKNKLYGFSN